MGEEREHVMVNKVYLTGMAGWLREPFVEHSNPRKALESVSLFFVKSFENGLKETEMSSCVRADVAVLLVRYIKKYFRAKFILFPGRECFSSSCRRGGLAGFLLEACASRYLHCLQAAGTMCLIIFFHGTVVH